MWCSGIAKRWVFLADCGGDALDNANRVDDAKSLPHIGSIIRCERGMAIAAVVSSVAAEHHGAEFGVHGDAIFYFCLCEIFGSSYADLGYYFFLHWVHNTATSYLRTYMLVTSGVSIKVTYSHNTCVY